MNVDRGSRRVHRVDSSSALAGPPDDKPENSSPADVLHHAEEELVLHEFETFKRAFGKLIARLGPTLHARLEAAMELGDDEAAMLTDDEEVRSAEEEIRSAFWHLYDEDPEFRDAADRLAIHKRWREVERPVARDCPRLASDLARRLFMRRGHEPTG
jgi:hypothetical protein